MVRGKMAFYEREREFFHIYLNEKHGLDFNEKHGLEVAPKDPHKRLLQDMYLQESTGWQTCYRKGWMPGCCGPWRPDGSPFSCKR